MECIQTLNTAIIKSKERKIDRSYENRLNKLGNSPTLKIINKAIIALSETEKITKDQAAIQIVETIRELDSIWNDYVVMEGIDRLKSILKESTH